MNNLLNRITIDPAICGGRPTIWGMRVRIVDSLDLLSNGLTPEQIITELPYLELDDVKAKLKYSSRN